MSETSVGRTGQQADRQFLAWIVIPPARSGATCQRGLVALLVLDEW